MRRILLIATDGEAVGPGYLDEAVCVVGRGHELGEHRVAQDGVVGQTEASHIEVDELRAVVLVSAEGDDESHIGQGGTWGDAQEGPGGRQTLVWHLELLESLHREHVGAGATVDERLGNNNTADGGST